LPDDSPYALPTELTDRWDRARDRLGDIPDAIAGTSDTLAAALPKVAVCSDFVVAILERDSEALIERLRDPEPPGAAKLDSEFDLTACSDESAAMARLRRVRNREMARIAWYDIAGTASLEQSLASLSLLADAAIRAALGFAIAQLEPRHGRAVDASGEPLPLLTLAMGKLGGAELNFSSDVDLIFLCPDGARMTHGSVEAEEYFHKLAQHVIRLLDQRTSEGFAYRVDTRLRPFGASGPLVVSLGALEAYLVRHGRDWERYAYIKARLVTGRDYEAELFDEILVPFVYRQYLDYGVFEALREMKALISKEVSRRDMADNLKLGPGGIREIEFIAQALQLVRGGRDAALRVRPLLEILPRLAAAGQLEDRAAAELEHAYRFLRRLENAIQAIADQQTHDVPDDPVDRARLACVLGYEDWNALAGDLAAQRRCVEQWFDAMALESTRGSPDSAVVSSWATAWQTGDFSDVLEEYGLGDDGEIAQTLANLQSGALYQRMDEPSRRRLASVIARLMTLLAGTGQPARLLRRVLPVLEAIGRRSAYLALLIENPAALQRLLTLSQQSEFLVNQIAGHPMLLDELLDPRVLETPPDRAELEGMLADVQRCVADEDIEGRLDRLRQFQRTAVFRVAIADRFGKLPLMKVSDRLTDIAELVIDVALGMARAELVQRYGKPMCGAGDQRREAGFIVVAYGKLGGLELGYGSDLDLVFLHDSAGEDQETDGQRAIDNGQFFVRLAQRLIHYLSIQTSSGHLYEIDTRLRPSGASGLLVSSLDAFRRYQREQAWIWEHQALLRSRSVAGSVDVREAFEHERKEVLTEHVERARLRDEIRNMRERMRAELSGSKAGEFDLKQDPGGLADIEFLVDYWVLSHAAELPELVEHPDNIRQLEALERTGLVPASDCRQLIDIYIRIRERLHELALDGGGRIVAAGELVAERRVVSTLWDAAFPA
jgi:glutamate-ammonia-ligase adenylyltransferase